jgi:hypothetical protein
MLGSIKPMKILIFTLLTVLPIFTWAGDVTEESNQLIEYVAALQGATFIRNGSEHSAKDAADHMRLKWEKQEKKIKTAEDFIALCASKSSMSGKRYLIRFANDSTVFSDELLLDKLKLIRKPETEE